MEWKVIDIHSHVLPNVDDGSVSTADSIAILKKAQEQGVGDMICTPHYRQNYKPTIEQLKSIFESFKKDIENEDINVKIHLGQEIFVGNDIKNILLDGKVLPLADSKYLLVEFDFIEDTDICEAVYQLKRMGYTVIVAHLERYDYVDLNLAIEIKRAGGLIQVNAESLVKKYGRALKKKAMNLFKANLVDFVASDVHVEREYVMEKAYKKVTSKFGQKTAENVFYFNAKKIIEG